MFYLKITAHEGLPVEKTGSHTLKMTAHVKLKRSYDLANQVDPLRFSDTFYKAIEADKKEEHQCR